MCRRSKSCAITFAVRKVTTQYIFSFSWKLRPIGRVIVGECVYFLALCLEGCNESVELEISNSSKCVCTRHDFEADLCARVSGQTVVKRRHKRIRLRQSR